MLNHSHVGGAKRAVIELAGMNARGLTDGTDGGPTHRRTPPSESETAHVASAGRIEEQATMVETNCDARGAATQAVGVSNAVAEASPARRPVVRLLRGDMVALEPVRWLWPGFLPAGMLTLLGGAPGCGKSTIALSLAATVTSGGDWPDRTPCDLIGDVLVWSGEDAPSVSAARLKAAGADMQRVHFIDGFGEGSFDPGRHMAALEATAATLAAPRLLILDPIVSAVPSDGHKNGDVRRDLQPVVDLAQRLGCAVLGITHFSKGTAGRDPVERITGSLAFAALARLVLVAAKVSADDGGSEQRRVLVRAKSNIGPDDGGFSYALDRVDVAPGVQGQRVVWGEALTDNARDALADAEADPNVEADSRADVEAFVRGCLRDGPVSAKDFKSDAAGAGYHWRSVQRAAKRLGAESRKTGMQGGWEWGFHGATKATHRIEGDEGDSSQRVSSLSSPASSSTICTGSSGEVDNSVSMPPLSPSQFCVSPSRVLPADTGLAVAFDAEGFEERAAIMEFDGGLTRVEAEARAREGKAT